MVGTNLPSTRSRDGRYGFIGSLNLDPRSVSLNTEMGILFDSPDLTAKMDGVFAEEINLQMSYPVCLINGKVRWRAEIDGGIVTLTGEPDASIWKRAVSSLIAWLPLESQL